MYFLFFPQEGYGEKFFFGRMEKEWKRRGDPQGKTESKFSDKSFLKGLSDPPRSAVARRDGRNPSLFRWSLFEKATQKLFSRVVAVRIDQPVTSLMSSSSSILNMESDVYFRSICSKDA